VKTLERENLLLNGKNYQLNQIDQQIRLELETALKKIKEYEEAKHKKKIDWFEMDDSIQENSWNNDDGELNNLNDGNIFGESTPKSTTVISSNSKEIKKGIVLRIIKNSTNNSQLKQDNVKLEKENQKKEKQDKNEIKRRKY
jgi:hypothetical protein